MTYSPQDINHLIREHGDIETRVLCVYWAVGDHVEEFCEDSRRLKALFVRLNYQEVEEYAIPTRNSQVELEGEIWKHLRAFRNGQSVFIIYYGGHGEKGGRGRWVAHDKIGRGPAIEWQSIQKRLSRFDGKILVIIDACFAGSAMRGAEDFSLSLRNMVGLQRGSRETIARVVPGNVELWLATSFHGQTPVKEPTFTQAIVHTLSGQLEDAGASLTILRAHKIMMELESGNKLQCQPIYQPLENTYQKSIEIHHFDVTKGLSIEDVPSTMIELKLKLVTLDEETMPMLIQWLGAHPSTVISQECQNIETCIRAAHQYVLKDVREPSPTTSLTPFQYLSDSLKQRTFDTYQKLIQSALALLRIDNGRPGVVDLSSADKLEARSANRKLEEAWTKFKEQMQQNILLGLDNGEEGAVLRMLRDPETRKLGLSQILHMRLLAMGDDEEEPAQSLKPPLAAETADVRLDGPLILSDNGVHAVEYKNYPANMDGQLRTIHEARIDRLAKVLREASSRYDLTSRTDFLTLNCLGYFSEPLKHRFGLKFELPSRHESSLEPISLWRALKSGKKYRLPLQQRLSLAYQISKALLNWHMAGWHHQEISSRNILFFSTSIAPEPDFNTPYLCGFDFSRESGKISTTRDSKDMGFSVYRHPERQFDTTKTHRLRHDIYSFGVVLLDLGLWDDPDASWKRAMKVQPVNDDQARTVYEQLQSFTGRLNFYVGSCFAEAARNCLNDRCFDGASDRETTEIFIDKVLSFALYRALLRQTPRLHLGYEFDHADQRRVRERLGNTFRHNAKIQSPPAVVTALRQGYHALDLLPATLHGDKEASKQLSQYVDALRSTAPAKSLHDQRCRRGRAEADGDAKKQEVEIKSTMTPASIFDRPFPNLSGRRTVPHLISANGFPFLRYQRQQPPALSRAINDRIKAYCNRWDRTYEYQDQVQMGKLEDAWERDLSRYCGFGRESDPGPSWSEEPLKALDLLHATSRRQSTRTRNMAMEMYHVMEKERELAKREKLARRDEKHRRYKEKCPARRELPDSEEEVKAAPAAMAGS